MPKKGKTGGAGDGTKPKHKTGKKDGKRKKDIHSKQPSSDMDANDSRASESGAST